MAEKKTPNSGPNPEDVLRAALLTPPPEDVKQEMERILFERKTSLNQYGNLSLY